MAIPETSTQNSSPITAGEGSTRNTTLSSASGKGNAVPRIGRIEIRLPEGTEPTAPSYSGGVEYLSDALDSLEKEYSEPCEETSDIADEKIEPTAKSSEENPDETTGSGLS